MRSEVGEWLATCVGSPICILLLSWSLLIYQSQPSSSKRRIDILTVAVLSESLAHQLGLLFYAILTLIRPTNHFGELCSTLVWILNSSNILQELTLTSIAIFAAISIQEDGITLTKNHIKYHLVSLSVISACIGITGVLNFEPQVCAFLPQEISTKYGIFVNSLRVLLVLTSILSVITTIVKNICSKPKGELLKSVSDLSETSSKNSSGAFECHTSHWDPSNGSCTSGSTNSRVCLRKSKVQVDEASGKSTIYCILFVCYVFQHLPILIISIRPNLLRGFCTVQNLATWLPLLKDTLLPIFLSIFDRLFCRYVAKVYTKQDHSRRLSHGTSCYATIQLGGIDGKFRHFEQDAEYKLQLNLNHGLKFPLTNGSLYGRLHNYQNRARMGTITMGIQHYPKSQSLNEEGQSNTYASLPPELTSFSSSTFEPKSCTESIKNSLEHQSQRQRYSNRPKAIQEVPKDLISKHHRKIVDVFGQNMENLVQLEENVSVLKVAPRKFTKSLDEIREEMPSRRQVRSVLGLEHLQDFTGKSTRTSALRRNQSFDQSKYKSNLDSRTYDLRRIVLKRDDHQNNNNNNNINNNSINCNENVEFEDEDDDEIRYESSSDDESCDFENGDFDTMSSCRSRSRSCCSVTTVANDDFEYFQRKGLKVELLPSKRSNDVKVNMRSFTPKIVEIVEDGTRNNNNNHEGNIVNAKKVKVDTRPTIQSYHLKQKKITSGYSMNDLDRFQQHENHPIAQLSNQLSMESLRSILKNSDVSYLDNGEMCKHDIGGSVPDFKRIFLTDYL